MVKSKTFSALQSRNYFLFWVGNVFSQTGDWLDQIALNWLVVSTTDSPLWLGVVNLGRGIPILLFSMIGGVVADRMNRKHMLIITQTCAMLVAVALAIAVYFGSPPIWFITLLALLRGSVVSFNMPARHSLITSLVNREQIASAVALNSMGGNLAKVLGPLIAAFIISTLGIAACFVINAATFIIILILLLIIKLPDEETQITVREGFFFSLRSGFSYLWNTPVIRLLVLVAIIPTYFCQPYLQMMAVFANDVFFVGAGGLGVMVSIAAAGAVSGGFLAAYVQRNRRKGSTTLIAMGGFALSLIAFANMPNATLAAPFIFMAGAMQVAYSSSNQTLLQMSVDDHYRGRVLSILLMTRGLVSIGTATMAFLATLVGTPEAMSIMSGLVVVFTFIIWFRAPRLRKLTL